MIVDCAIYRDGGRESVHGDLSDALDEARGTPDGFLWIGLHEPTTEEFDLVSDEFKLHPLAIEDAVNAHQRPKLERYGDILFLVLKTLTEVNGRAAFEIGEIMLFLGDRFVVTVRHGAANPLTEVRHRLEEDPEMLRLGTASVLHGVLDEIVDSYEVIAQDVEDAVGALEDRVFSPERTNDAEDIHTLKRKLVAFRGAVRPLVPAAQSLVTGAWGPVHGDLRPYMRDVADHVLRVSGRVESIDDLLTSVLNANLAQVSVRQNEDMRKISAWAAIIAVPTAVAGIYGMNFKHMPELGWRVGYPGAVALMATLCFVLHRAFRRSGWL